MPGGDSGGSGNGGTGKDDSDKNPVDNSPLTADNFVQKVITEKFKSEVKDEPGVDPDEIPIIVNSNAEHSAGANAAYKDNEKTIHVYEEMFGRNYTHPDMESIMYHEYVHARQNIVDGITYERDEKDNIISEEYIIPTTQNDVDKAWEDFYVILEINNVSRDKNQRSPIDEQFYQMEKRSMLILSWTASVLLNGSTRGLPVNTDYLHQTTWPHKFLMELHGENSHPVGKPGFFNSIFDPA